MKSLSKIVRGSGTTKSTAWFLSLWAPLTGVWLITCVLGVLAKRNPFQSEDVFASLFILGLMQPLSLFPTLWAKKYWFPPPRYGGSALVRQLIAEAPRDPLSVVAIEGRVARANATQELVGPLSGLPCVYYRVRIEQWVRVPQVAMLWVGAHDVSSVKPFVVADETGRVLVDTVERDEAQWGDSTGVDLDVCRRVTRYESKVGVQGLPPPVRAYLETTRKRFESLGTTRPIRITEVVLREDDVVSILGSIEEPKEQGAYRDNGGSARMLAMVASPRVFAARLEDIRGLVAFHRRLTLALALGGALGFVAMGLGLVGLAMR